MKVIKLTTIKEYNLKISCTQIRCFKSFKIIIKKWKNGHWFKMNYAGTL